MSDVNMNNTAGGVDGDDVVGTDDVVVGADDVVNDDNVASDDNIVGDDVVNDNADDNNAVNDDVVDDNVDDDNAAVDEDTDNKAADNLRILEALLFASDELLTAAKLKTLLPNAPDVRTLRKMVNELNEQLAKEGHPFEIAALGGGYQFRTAAAYHVYVRKLYKERAAKKLSLQALECLAIIAYRQPISKAEVEAVRGVLSDGAMKTLLERKLVDIVGRSDKPGRPLLYGTTADFLKYFGINKLSDLPRIEEFEALALSKMEELDSQELIDEQSEMLSADNVGQDNVADDNVGQNDIADDNVVNNNVGQDNVADDNAGQNNVIDNNVTNDNVADDNVVNNNIADDNVADNNVGHNVIDNNVNNNNDKISSGGANANDDLS